MPVSEKRYSSFRVTPTLLRFSAEKMSKQKNLTPRYNSWQYTRKMLKVLPQNVAKILNCRTIGAPRDIFKISCNFTTNPGSSSTGRIPAPKSYTFKQKQNGNTGNITSYGWIMLVRGFSILRHLVNYIKCLQAIPLTTFALGCWQVQRKKWKERLIDELDIQTNSLPVDLPVE